MEVNYILDPLSVIIKLAILNNKPIGTKIYIHKNIIYLQEPGYLQGISRYVYNINKNDLQYLYNPIEIACKIYLNNTNNVIANVRIKELFINAQKGLENLMETYKNESLLKLCLNYYYILIANYLKENKETIQYDLFRPDNMTLYYNDDLLIKLGELWNVEKVKLVFNLISYLSNTNTSLIDVKSLEIIMDNIDKQTSAIINKNIEPSLINNDKNNEKIQKPTEIQLQTHNQVGASLYQSHIGSQIDDSLYQSQISEY